MVVFLYVRVLLTSIYDNEVAYINERINKCLLSIYKGKKSCVLSVQIRFQNTNNFFFHPKGGGELMRGGLF